MRIALGLSYEGSRLSGWQSQPGGNTVQDHLERALAGVAGTPIRAHAAGRTDAGVHATGQIAHFDVDVDRPESAWVRGVNAGLPDSIAVQWARVVDPEFHARFSAIARTYHYILYVHPVRPALFAEAVGWYHHSVRLDLMQQAADQLLGTHDFTCFRASECQAKTPIRTVSRAHLRALDPYIIVELRADAFLHHMVRNILGSLVYVGKGKFPPEWFAELLKARNRDLAAPTFSPAGLYLSRVEYDAHWGIPETSFSLPWMLMKQA